MFAWAKNAPPLQLPKDVGRHVGPGAGIDYIVLQIHYARVFAANDEPDHSGIRIYLTQERQKFVAGIYLLLAFDTVIPANTSKVHADISCRFDWQTSIFPFGFRTHAHSLGRVISGYRFRNDSYELIGKGNPQWPQAFYPVGKTVEVKPGDVLAAQCTYSSIGRDRVTRIGGTHNDEMCNFYIMYYMDAAMEDTRGSSTCPGNNEPLVSANLPADSDTPLPPNPVLEEDAKGHAHHTPMQGSGGSPQIADIVPSHKEPTTHPKMNLKFVQSVPKSDSIVFGQVGGVATNEEGDIYIFHRGSRVWNSLSFNLYNVYQMQNNSVETDAIVIIDKNDNVKRSFGRGMFYLPHGLTVDKKGNIWVTDVALHQVFRFPPNSDKPDLTLGERFVPGNDEKHFCKPTDVAVLSTGEFFVSDGYCNARVMKFDKNGYFLKQWGMTNGARAADGYPYPSAFNVPHSITVAEDRGLVCVADRENGRIQCFDLEGDFIRQMHLPSFGSYLYAIEYCHLHGGVLFAVNGPDYSDIEIKVQGFTIEIDTGKLRATWNLPNQGLTSPHDVTVHSSSHTVYVGELNPAKVWKFEMVETSSNTGQVKATTAPIINTAAVDRGGSSVFTGHHRYKDPTPIYIPTAGKVLFPEESTPNSDSESDSGENELNESFGVEDNAKTNLEAPHNETGAIFTAVSGNIKDLDDSELQKAEVKIDAQKFETIKEREKDSFAPALIIGLLLVVPVILLVLITVVVRLYQTGYLGECGKGRSKKKIKFNLGNILNSHKGFDRLSTEDDDHDIDVALDDSDQEEFNITKNSKA